LLILSCGGGEDKVKNKKELTSHRISTNKKAVVNTTVDSSLIAPNFALPRMNGEQFQLAKHKGKVIILNFFATWCGPCIAELPDFIALHNAFSSKEVMIIGVSYDVKGWDVVRPFVKKHEINYPVILDKERTLQEKYYTTALPNTFIINQQGELAHMIFSPTNEKLLKPLITELISK
jgi:peroxiredoxin